MSARPTTNTLVHVDGKLIVPIGAKLVGSVLSSGNEISAKGGFNWFVQASLKQATEQGVETRVSDLFAEDIFRTVYDKLAHRQLSVQTLCRQIQATELQAADIVSVVGTLRIPGVNLPRFDPFDPPTIEMPTYMVSGEQCFAAQLEDAGFLFPIYWSVRAKEVVCYCNNKPVEVMGVLKWSPAYEVAGSSLNHTLLSAALLLRR